MFPLLVVLSLVACSTTPVTLDYKPAQAEPPPRVEPLVAVGDFADDRGTDPHWLGAIRGGMGNPLKTLEFSEGASAAIARGFAQGLAARGLLAKGKPARFTLTAAIHKFDCSQLVRREAHADLLLTLTETATGKMVLQQPIQRDIVQDGSAFATGILASTEDLRAVAADLLRQTVDAGLDSAAFKQVVAQQ